MTPGESERFIVLGGRESRPLQPIEPDRVVSWTQQESGAGRGRDFLCRLRPEPESEYRGDGSELEG
jgi:hypothetical protein